MTAIGAPKRLRQVASEFNLGITSIVEFLGRKGIELDPSPNTKIEADVYQMLANEFQSEKNIKEASAELAKEFSKKQKNVTLEAKMSLSDEVDVSIEITEHTKPHKEPKQDVIKASSEVKTAGPKIIGKMDIEPKKPKVEEKPVVIEPPVVEKPAEEIEKPEVIAVEKPAVVIEPVKEVTIVEVEPQNEVQRGPKVIGKLDADKLNATNRPVKKDRHERDRRPDQPKKELRLPEKPVKEVVIAVEQPKQTTEQPKIADDPNFIKTRVDKVEGPKILGKMDLPTFKKKKDDKKSADTENVKGESKNKKKRKRIVKDTHLKVDNEFASKEFKKATPGGNLNNKKKKKKPLKPELTEEDVQKQIKETLARLSDTKKSTAVKHRRNKRDKYSQTQQQEFERLELEKKILKTTEFVSANELANMIGVSVNEIISVCMTLGLIISINQRLDAETIVIVAEEFGYEVKFVDIEDAEDDDEPEIEEPDNDFRAPIVTVMGHVDHGKTSLLDYIRNTNVIAGEAGGITQHIGAYEVTLEDGRNITFLDTPGHEAFTAMRARGSKVTDIAVIVVAADDNIMPQTKEAINHAQAAGVPIIFAINKIDKAGANPEKIKEGLAGMNLLVEDWGGKIQSQDISAKKGTNVKELMEKILLEAEMLELKANNDKLATGTVLEAFLDKGKGYVANVLVQNGTLKVGDTMLVGTTYGKIKAMYNERNKRIKEAGPASPALILGLNNAPIAGDNFKVMVDEREAKNIANKREQLQRQQSVHTKKHITLDEIGRRLAIGDFKELNIIVKGDVDGSVEALSDSLEKLSNQEVQVNIIHKAVGQINEADVTLASASDAIIVGFQVRPSVNARRLAEKEHTDIRLYSIIYQAIGEIKSAIEGMLAPIMKEEIVCNIEVRETFKITKIGTIAGCYMLDGKINRNDKIRVIRDGIVIYTGGLGSLKRFKDDVKEVTKGFECGLNIENFNDIKVGDIIEGYKEVEVARAK